jgi:2-polyprenyl-3-methyl-5-hydroxy-6-metoxy-1,4-benzoquinol methylase
MSFNLAKRSNTKEELDNLNLKGDELHTVLSQLALINKFFGTYRDINNGVKILTKPGTLNVIDIGCGGGDVSNSLFNWGTRNKANLSVKGIDGNYHSINYAKNNYSKPGLSFDTEEINDFNLKDELIIASNFIYHLTDIELVKFLQHQQKRTKHGLVFSELNRNPIAVILFTFLCRILFLNKIIRKDGITAIKRAFTYQELKFILEKAGIKNYHLNRKPCYRLQLIIFPN